MRIDLEKTHQEVVKILSRQLCPWHYRQMYHQALRQTHGDYSEKTDPPEKLRQFYAEHPKAGVVFLKGGYLALHRWFPDKVQSVLWKPEPLVIRGNCIIAWEAGYELGLRIPHMMDHYRDFDTPARHERQRRGSLVEAHIKSYFASEYPDFYQPPRNEKKYDRPAKEDFFLELPDRRLGIDVKSWSYLADDGDSKGVARKPRDNILYLWGDWLDNEAVEMTGICSGQWLKQMGIQKGDMVHVEGKQIFSVEVLLVMLNMAKAGMSYMDSWRYITQVEKVK